MKRNKKKSVSKLDKLLELPDELISNEPKITIISFNKCLIENYKSILEYQEFYIRLSTYIGIININGFNMKLNEMTNDDLLIEGKIESIDFESTVENEGE
jgi:sporulation protein YqfC